MSVFGLVIRSFHIHATFLFFLSSFSKYIFFLNIEAIFQLKLGIYYAEEHFVS